MSLINDALKRANQAQKPAGEEAPGGPPMQPVVEPPKGGMVLMIGAGALILIVLGLGIWLVSIWISGSKKAAAKPAGTNAPVAQVTTAAPPATVTGQVTRATAPAKATAKPAKPGVKPAIATVGTSTPPALAGAPAVTPPPVAVAGSTNLPDSVAATATAPASGAVHETPPEPVIVTEAPPPAKTVAAAGRTAAGSTSRAPTTAAKPTVRSTGKTPAPAAPTVDATGFPNLKLQGIYFRPSNPSALINSQTVYVGDEIEGAVVKSIDGQKVVVEFNGQSRSLRAK